MTDAPIVLSGYAAVIVAVVGYAVWVIRRGRALGGGLHIGRSDASHEPTSREPTGQGPTSREPTGS